MQDNTYDFVIAEELVVLACTSKQTCFTLEDFSLGLTPIGIQIREAALSALQKHGLINFECKYVRLPNGSYQVDSTRVHALASFDVLMPIAEQAVRDYHEQRETQSF